MKDVENAIITIIQSKQEIFAISVLVDSLGNRLKKATSENCEYRASLMAIKKINNRRNFAIDTLCE